MGGGGGALTGWGQWRTALHRKGHVPGFHGPSPRCPRSSAHWTGCRLLFSSDLSPQGRWGRIEVVAAFRLAGQGTSTRVKGVPLLFAGFGFALATASRHTAAGAQWRIHALARVMVVGMQRPWNLTGAYALAAGCQASHDK